MKIDCSRARTNRFSLFFFVLALPSTMATAADTTPFGPFPATVPGVIEAEEFDEGGPGAAYVDTTPQNIGNAFRTNTSVDIEVCSDIGGGYDIGWIEPGEWLIYTINVLSAGRYTIEARTASAVGGGIFHIEFDGADKTGPMVMPTTGDLQNWQSVAIQGVLLESGVQTMRIVMDSNATNAAAVGNLNYLSIYPTPQTEIIAGTGVPGFADGPANQAQFSSSITGIRVDRTGAVYVTDAGNLRIRKVFPSGFVTTLAATTNGLFNGLDHFCTLITQGPNPPYDHGGNDLAVDGQGSCYVVDGCWDRAYVRKVTPDGTITNLWQFWTALRYQSHWLPSILTDAAGALLTASVDSYYPPSPASYSLFAVQRRTAQELEIIYQSGPATNVLFGEVAIDFRGGLYFWRADSLDLFFFKKAGIVFISPSGVASQLFEIPSPVDIYTLAVDGDRAFYFRKGTSLVKLSASGHLQTVVPNFDAAARFAVDYDGTIYTTEGARIVKITGIAAQRPVSGAAFVIPGIIEAEQFDEGGEGVSYHDSSPRNEGGAYRTHSAVDIEPCGDTGGGADVGWITPGEWLEYTVDVANSGAYTVEARVSSPVAGGAFHIEFDGINKTGSLTIPNTGSWQSWQTVKKDGVQLNEGRQVMRLVMDTAGESTSFVGNLNYVRFYEQQRLRGIITESDRHFQVYLSGEPDAWYRIEASTNLTAWSPLATNRNVNGFIQYSDQAVTNWSHRFFRSSKVPLP